MNKVRLCAIIIVGFGVGLAVDSVGENSGEETWCNNIREKYGVIPGKSFGNLPSELHRTYLLRKCYRFFCEPHPMAGKGVFECVPLKKNTEFT